MKTDLFERDAKYIEDINQRLHDDSLKGETINGAFKETIERYDRLLRTTRRLVRVSDLISNKQRVNALTDGLTEVDNRRAFMTSLKRETGRAQRFKQPLSMLFCDIDHFKKVNDTYGHEAGDVALRDFPNTMAGSLRDIDLFGRLGGEEFGAILPGTDHNGAGVSAERLRRQVEEMVVDAGPVGTFQFTVSIGVSQLRREDDDASLLARADAALYQAKNGGRNRTVFVE